MVSIARFGLDEKDVRILRALEKDARTSFADIARDCGVSIDTITKRYRKMLRNGPLRGTTILLDPRSLGYDCIASVEVDVEFQRLDDVAEALRASPRVVFCTPSLGMKDVFAIAFLETVGDLSRLLSFVKGLEGVKEVKSSIWVDDYMLCPENFDLSRVMK